MGTFLQEGLYGILKPEGIVATVVGLLMIVA